MILVTGAAGKTGKAVIKALIARGVSVRAFVRSPSHQAGLRGLGVREVVIGEMDDRQALAQAMNGAETVYHICPNVSPHEIAYGKAMIEAATRTGVVRVVYHSVLHPQIEAMPHHWSKMRVEELLFSARLGVTILQPTAYMQNTLAEWNRMVSAGIFRVPYPVETRLSLVDLDDLAEAAALVLAGDGHIGATYELVGTAPMSQIEIADAFARALQRDVRAEAESIDAWRDRARRGGMDDHQRETLIKMFEAYARDGLRGNPNVLSWLIGRQPTSVAEFAVRSASNPGA